MRSSLLALCCLIAFNAEAQLTFQKLYGGTWADNNECMNRSTGAVTTVHGSGYAIAHTTQSYGPVQYQPSIYFLRLNNNGDTITTRVINNGSSCYGRSIYALSDGGFIVGANMTGTNYHMGLLRLDNMGDTIWTKAFGSTSLMTTGYYGMPSFDGGFIACGQGVNISSNMVGTIGKVDANGAYVFGNSYTPSQSGHQLYFYSTYEGYDHSIIATGAYYTSQLAWRPVIMKTDSAGNVIWCKTFGNPGTACGYRVMELPDHSILATGLMDSGGFGDADAFVIKTDANGNLQWEKIYGDNQYQWLNSMTLMPNGTVTLCGLQETFNNQSNAWLLNIDQSGTVQWTNRYGGAATDLGNSLTLADDGGVAFTGFANSFGAGNTDIYFVKTDGVGQTSCYITPVTISDDTISVTVNSPTIVTAAVLSVSNLNCTENRGAIVTTLCTTVGMEEPDENSFAMYPNPVNDQLVIKGKFSNATTITITDVAGRTVMCCEKNDAQRPDQISINVAALPDGMYILSMISGNNRCSQRLVISHNSN